MDIDDGIWGDVSNLRKKIADLANRVTATEENLRGVTTRTITQATEISSLESEVRDLTSDKYYMQSQISGLESKISDLERGY